MSSTPEDQVLESIHYDMVEMITNAAVCVVEMHPDNNKEQVNKMFYLFAEAIHAFVQSMPGLDKHHVLEVAAKSFDLARMHKQETLPPTESMN